MGKVRKIVAPEAEKPGEAGQGASFDLEWSGFLALNDTNTDDVPEDPGIYLLWQRHYKDRWKLFYVGDTTNLRAALKQHISTSEPDPLIRRRVFNCVLGFEAAICMESEMRSGIARYLFEHCQPEHKCVLTCPDAEKIFVNLP